MFCALSSVFSRGRNRNASVTVTVTVSDVAGISQAIARAPLPTFSALVLQNIQGKGAVPEKVCSLMVNAAAHYYFSQWPEIGDHQHYHAIGVKMYAKYPAIGSNGPNPWVSRDLYIGFLC